jgi:hypothetical protein
MLTKIPLPILLINTLIILSHQQNQSNPKLQYPSVCTPNQTAMITQAINACQLNDISSAVVCIRDYIQKNYNGQTWNVFVKNTDTNLDAVAFWYINKCVAQFTNFGTLNRTYVLWMYGASNQSMVS